MIDFLLSTQDALRQLPQTSLPEKAFVGLDGYIDLIQRPVQARTNDDVTYFSTIADFAAHLGKAAGKSAQVELVTQETKLGGNSPIMANALGTFGFSTTCLGTFGEDNIEKVFLDVSDKVNMLSVGDASNTNAMEFDDGKLIFSELSPFRDLKWEKIKERCSLDTLVYAMDSASLIALVDWCNLPHSTNFWQGMQKEALPRLSKKDRTIFFDIADPTRRSDAEVFEALATISGYVDYGEIVLGLNENETEKVFDCLNRHQHAGSLSHDSLEEKATFIYEHIGLHMLVVHPTNRSFVIDRNGITEMAGRVVGKPKISTGGGDNFNAGFCAGKLLKLTTSQSLILGMASSGSYVQNGRSSSIDDLIEYLQSWINEFKA